ncbi:MAG: hypothetical protein ACI82A_002751 [Candidatus Azotimanducaceae bacterium]|jgi:hypothetical protein
MLAGPLNSLTALKLAAVPRVFTESMASRELKQLGFQYDESDVLATLRLLRRRYARGHRLRTS